MFPKLKQYLANVRLYSRLDPKAETEIVRELQTHFEDEVGELREAGFSTAEAVDVATEHFGAAKALGGEIYEVYSKGTWRQALLSATPHLLIAVTFAFHLWQSSLWLLSVALAIIGVTIYAWHRDKPSWFYSWLGYSLIPLFAFTFLVLFVVGRVLSRFALEGSMQWVVILIYIPVALWLLAYILIRVIRRDWLLASFMLLPFPVIVAWLIAAEQDVGLAEFSRSGFPGGDQGVAFTFVALAGAAATFIRLRRRLFKIGVLGAATLLILAMVWRFSESGLNPVVALFISSTLIVFLMSPILLQGRLVRGTNDEIEAWDEAWLEQAARRT